MTDALYITAWHDPERGFEPSYRRGREMKRFDGAPGWFFERVHRGEKFAGLVHDYGPRDAFALVGVYNQLRQVTATLSRAQRGYVLTRFGRAHTTRSLLSEFALPAEIEPWFAEQIARLCHHGWLAWRPYPPVDTSEQCAHSTAESEHCAHSVRPRAHLKDKDKDKDKDKHKEERAARAACERIFDAYPRKVGKVAALKAIAKALVAVRSRCPTGDPAAWLLDQVQAYARARAGADHKFTPYPATWFNQGHYDDDVREWRRDTARFQPTEAQVTFREMQERWFAIPLAERQVLTEQVGESASAAVAGDAARLTQALAIWEQQRKPK